MKANQLNNILLTITFLLFIAMFLCILFGCSYKKYREPFSVKQEKQKEDTSVKEEDEKNEDNGKQSFQDSKQSKVKLSQFENEIKKGVAEGSITEDKMEELIKSEKFTQQNLSNILSSIEEEIKTLEQSKKT